MPVLRCLFLAFAMLASVAHAGTGVLPPGAVLVDEATTKGDPARLAIAAGEVLARVEAGDAGAAFARLGVITDPLQYELTAARVIDALMTHPRKAGDALLARLEAVPVRVFRRHDETAADWFLPLVDVGARARSARRVIASNAARDAALAALAADPRSARSIDADTLALAVALLPPAKADVLAAVVACGDVALDSRPLAQLALRTANAAVWKLALDRGAAEHVLPLFAEVDARLPEVPALQWLQAASKDARYASAAVIATGRLASRSPAAAAALDDYLGRADTGPSAAAVLASAAGPGFLPDIRQRLAKAKDPLRVQHLALALRLADTPEAATLLRTLQDDPRLSAAAKSELQR
jgi:hypothetical protein